MYGVDEGSNDLDTYFKILETEARELRTYPFASTFCLVFF